MGRRMWGWHEFLGLVRRAAQAALIAMALAAQAQATPVAAPTPQSPAAPRVIALHGQANFRDLGGYDAADGRHVKSGAIYRSGELSHLDASDYRRIADLGIRAVFDLRTDDERRAEPTRWGAGPVETFVAAKNGAIFSSDALLDHGRPSAAKAREAMLALYREMPDEYAPELKALFAELLTRQTPVLVHCTAGKDRTGLAAALILTALGTPRDEVLQDYALSNRFVTAAIIGRTETGRAMLDRLPPDVVSALLAADPDYLEASFAAIDQEYGSTDNYFKTKLSLGPEQIAELRANLLR